MIMRVILRIAPFFLHVTGLHGNSAGDAGNYGCKEFKDFGDCSPIDFSHNILVLS